jgi:hypothetical protein
MRRKRDTAEKKLADDAKLLRMWRKYHRDERDTVLAGPHGTELSELLRLFRNLEHCRPTQVIGFARTIDWSKIPDTARLVVLHEFDVAAMKLRVKRGLPPIDDSLPGQPDNVFLILRALLADPSNDGATRGEARLNQTEITQHEVCYERVNTN